jgi:glucan 1,3-beta-glucosidase
VIDAFWGPTYWTDFDPSNPFGRGTSTPNYLHLDTHQYYAFAPVNNLTRTQILQSICNVSQILKSPQQESGIPGTVVGEWSLETTSSPATGEEQTDGVLGSSSGERETDQERRTWFRLLFEAQARAYEPESGQVGVQVGKGWYYWTCESPMSSAGKTTDH